MTLRRTMVIEIAATIAALILLTAASLWGLHAIHQDFDAALAGYHELRQVYEVGSHLTTARALLTLPHPDLPSAQSHIQAALDTYALYLPPPSHTDHRKHQLRLALRNALANAYAPPDDEQRIPAINLVLTQLANLVNELRLDIEHARQAGENNRRTATITLAAVSTIVVLAAILVGAWQYRTVIRPLHRLGLATRTIAAGQFADRVPTAGHAEFARLADDFNHMASELHNLYRQLEQKVASKSKELVRSERLASVGYLAAGVAHEINNPIGIIAGHAELMLSKLAQEPHPDPELQHTLRVICEEAFRCKDIVAKLLSLARPADDTRKPLSLPQLAQSVITMLTGLAQHRDKQITLHPPNTPPPPVLANENEIKQVLINLLINALDAVPDKSGLVSVLIRHDRDFVELAVADNGRGMTPDVLDRVFEPFFTAQRGRGIGLGLSITHAIVQNHGGLIHAHSDGPGLGSRFVLRLPALHGAAS